MKYEITEDQIKELAKWKHGKRLTQEWFPEAFASNFEVGKWYKITTDENYFLNWQGEDKECYGIMCDRWSNEYFFDGYHKANSTPATESEVFEALKKEAVKRGFVDGTKFKSPFSNRVSKLKFDSLRLSITANVLTDGMDIFFEGKWAEIIKEKTLSKSEAEAMINEFKNDGYVYKIG